MTHTIAVGQRLDSWCTRCKLMLEHTVETMIGAKITRVHCNTCKTQHAYRPQPPAARPAGSRAQRPGTRRPERLTLAVEDEYATLLKGRDASRARAYTTHDQFAPNDLIAHPTFGLGIVRTLKDRTKIDVLFRDGLKTIVHAQ